MAHESAAWVSYGPAHMACTFSVGRSQGEPPFKPSAAMVCAALHHSVGSTRQAELASLLIVPDELMHRLPENTSFRQQRSLIGLSNFVDHHLTRKQQRAFQEHLAASRVVGSSEQPPPVHVLMVTFNQGEWSNPKDAAVRARVRAFLLQHQATSDVIVLATQEADDALPSIFTHVLRAGFDLLSSKSLWQMKLGSLQLHVWVRRRAFHTISLIVSDDLRCGILSSKTVAKGCVYSGLSWQRSSDSPVQQTLFANVHLPSDQDDFKARSDCLVRIVQTLEEVMLKQGHDVTLFLMGDLNYRTHGKVKKSDASLRKQIFNYRWNEPSSLVFRDQLDQEMLENNDLRATGLREIAHRKFCPTCKFRVTKEEGKDVRRYDDQRYPSWCDRILIREALETTRVQCLEYKNWLITPESDHDAVFAVASIAELSS